MQGLNPFRRKNSGQNIYLFGSCRVLSFFTTTFFDQKHISSKKLVAKKHNTRQWPSKLFLLPRVFSMGPCLFRRVFSTRRWPPDVQGPFGDQSRRKNSTRTRQMTRSSSFFVQIGSQRVPERPEAKSCQILIRSGLLEAILEASRPASQPASQAQPLGRVF